MKKFLFSYFCFCFCFFTFFASGFVDSQDGFLYLTIARRMYYDKTFEMPVESFPEENIHMSTMKAKDGKIYSPTGLGYSLSLLPAVLLEDVFLRLSDTEPISAFPLRNDWPVLLFASMTNSFWAALLVVTFYLFLRELSVEHKPAIFLSFILTVATNLFVYAKHSFAHMMFTSVLFLTFLCIKKSSKSKHVYFMLLAGFAYSIVVISYNPTYLFPIPAIGIYYLFTHKINFSLFKVKELLNNLFFALVGALPIITLYAWFNSIRFGDAISTGYGTSGIEIPQFPPIYVIIEGFWGLLVSPGKSIFLFSPILLIIILFWFHLKKKIYPELLAGLALFFVYLWYIGTLLGGVDFLLWHGDSSWGPRYMLPTLPLLLLLVGYIFTKLTKRQKILVFFPLLLFGLYVNLLGILLPYQIRFAGLQTNVHLNGREFNMHEYGNEIPRYSPIFKQSKTLFQRLGKLDQLFDHGTYNLRLVDGFDYPFDIGWSVWRGMQPSSVFLFNSKKDQGPRKLSLKLKNHQIDPVSTKSATLKFIINGQEVKNGQNFLIPTEQEKEFNFDLSEYKLLEKNNEMLIHLSFESTAAAYLKGKQVLFLQSLSFDDIHQNIRTIDYPYVSEVSKNLFDAEYTFWGKIQTNPWEIWHMHSGVYEQTFDLWWLRPFHYWDYPKNFFISLFILDFSAIIYFGYRTLCYKH